MTSRVVMFCALILSRRSIYTHDMLRSSFRPSALLYLQCYIANLLTSRFRNAHMLALRPPLMIDQTDTQTLYPHPHRPVASPELEP